MRKQWILKLTSVSLVAVMAAAMGGQKEVASRTFLSGRKVLIPLIKPMVPMEIKSSWSPLGV